LRDNGFRGSRDYSRPRTVSAGGKGTRARSEANLKEEQRLKIRFATLADVDAIKRTADECRAELGFHTRQSFRESIEKHELFVAVLNGQPAGFLRYHQTRAGHTTLREVAASRIYRGRGIGQALIERLIAEAHNMNSSLIRLSCPVELPANEFYRSLGFRRAQRRSKPGKSRPLYQWELALREVRSLAFVASVTNGENDLKHLIPLWEKEGFSERPFDHCIITPLFIEPRMMPFIRHMREAWGVSVWFDSGGFFVQQGKIRYEELFTRLLEFYRHHDWAEVYVLPDYVPTSQNSPTEVEERVRVTAAEGAKFHKRLPDAIRNRTLGVLQGHKTRHLRLCLDSFLGEGVHRLGFGSFDTGGGNAEINLLTREASVRLEAVRELLSISRDDGHFAAGVDLHLFGVGSPNLVDRFVEYGTTSFDSSGWMRTAGYGNVYLPFRGRRNVTNGASALTCGPGLSAREFYALCEETGHDCPFCANYKRIQTNRFDRMWHNAIVFGEMTRSINSRTGHGWVRSGDG
jgi:ribosomal protein S18 acetylase RimI-like enzyme